VKNGLNREFDLTAVALPAISTAQTGLEKCQVDIEVPTWPQIGETPRIMT
jgi:hypothetical protein